MYPVAPALSPLPECTSHSVLQGRDVFAGFLQVLQGQKHLEKKVFFLVQIFINSIV
jgi:hypothetical protein